MTHAGARQSPNLTWHAMRRSGDDGARMATLARLAHVSPRQDDILQLIVQGLGDQAIAHELGLSVATIRSHLRRLYRLNGLHSRAAAAGAFLGSSQIEQTSDASWGGYGSSECDGQRKVERLHSKLSMAMGALISRQQVSGSSNDNGSRYNQRLTAAALRAYLEAGETLLLALECSTT